MDCIEFILENDVHSIDCHDEIKDNLTGSVLRFECTDIIENICARSHSYTFRMSDVLWKGSSGIGGYLVVSVFAFALKEITVWYLAGVFLNITQIQSEAIQFETQYVKLFHSSKSIFLFTTKYKLISNVLGNEWQVLGTRLCWTIIYQHLPVALNQILFGWHFWLAVMSMSMHARCVISLDTFVNE